MLAYSRRTQKPEHRWVEQFTPRNTLEAKAVPINNIDVPQANSSKICGAVDVLDGLLGLLDFTKKGLPFAIRLRGKSDKVRPERYRILAILAPKEVVHPYLHSIAFGILLLVTILRIISANPALEFHGFFGFQLEYGGKSELADNLFQRVGLKLDPG